MEGEGPAETPLLRIPPPPFLAEPALRAVMTALPEARVVGGAVRDALIGRPVADIDLASPLPPAEVVRRLEQAGLRAVPTGLAHGTVTAISGHRGFEITTLRRDLVTDGRHARVGFTTQWRTDAARRDFTINALSLRADGAVFDYFGGVADLRAGRVRFIGEAAARIAEDYLRILRFFRFQASYGRQPADAAALAAIRANVAGLAGLSAERVWGELRRLLATTDPASAVAAMHTTGVLGAVLPGAAPSERFRRLLAAGAPAEPILRLAALVGLEAPATAARLRLSREEAERLVALSEGEVPADDADTATLRRALAVTPREVLLGRAWLAGRGESLRARLQMEPKPEFPLRGRDLRAAGVPEGPELGALLQRLRQWWLAGGCMASRDACKAELARLRAG
jgi:poly(A) polymerase/tRNA nucleotidyltransferase (CCA-adding enzyme)